MCMSTIFTNLHKRKARIQAVTDVIKKDFPNHYIPYTAPEIVDKLSRWERISIWADRTSMIRNASIIADIILQRPRMIFHTTPLLPFITSDYPIYLHDSNPGSIYSVGYGTAEFIGFPLSKNSYLYIWQPEHPGDWKYKNLYNIVDERTVQMMNLCTCHRTERLIIGNSEELIKQLDQEVEKCDAEYRAKRWIKK